MDVKEVKVDDPRKIIIHTRNSVYTCSEPNFAGQRRVFKGKEFLFEGTIFGIVVLPEEMAAFLPEEKGGKSVVISHDKPYPDGRIPLAIGKIIVGKGVAFDFTNLNTGTDKGPQLDSLATSDVVRIEVD